MKRSKNYKFQSRKKKKSNALTISLLISSLIATSLVIWIWMNDWNVEKSYNRVGQAIGLIDDNDHTVVAPVEEVPETEDSDKKNDKAIENEEIPEIEEPQKTEELIRYIEGQELPVEPTYVKDILIASKKYPLPSTFAPGESEEARAAYKKLEAAALLDGFNLTAFSTYRSFEYQTGLYQRYTERDGAEEADRYSARPGYSEHQTGLAFDIGEVNREQDWASARFGDTEAGKWIAANGHRFGFIMRYPEGKEAITGYMHESWHFRYVGLEIATEIYNQKITLEEYLGI